MTDLAHVNLNEAKYLVLTNLRELDDLKRDVAQNLDPIDEACRRILHWTAYIRAHPDFEPPGSGTLVLDPNWADDLEIRRAL
jgi:hypothetical protein